MAVGYTQSATCSLTSRGDKRRLVCEKTMLKFCRGNYKIYEFTLLTLGVWDGVPQSIAGLEYFQVASAVLYSLFPLPLP